MIAKQSNVEKDYRKSVTFFTFGEMFFFQENCDHLSKIMEYQRKERTRQFNFELKRLNADIERKHEVGFSVFSWVVPTSNLAALCDDVVCRGSPVFSV